MFKKKIILLLPFLSFASISSSCAGTPKLKSINVNAKHVSFKIGETIDASNYEIIGEYSDGSKKTLTNYSVEEMDFPHVISNEDYVFFGDTELTFVVDNLKVSIDLSIYNPNLLTFTPIDNETCSVSLYNTNWINNTQYVFIPGFYYDANSKIEYSVENIINYQNAPIDEKVSFIDISTNIDNISKNSLIRFQNLKSINLSEDIYWQISQSPTNIFNYHTYNNDKNGNALAFTKTYESGLGFADCDWKKIN